jgi:hypothetical protein
MTVLGKRGVMRNFLIEARPGKPAPGQMHTQLLDQLAFTRDAVQVADQQDAQEEFRIDRRSAGLAVGIFQFFAYDVEADVSIDGKAREALA